MQRIEHQPSLVFDLIMAPDLWEPKFKASPYDRSISKAKAMERRSKRTSHELEAPQSKTNTDPKHGKQKSQPQNPTHQLDKPYFQNQQHKKQQKQQQQTKQQQKQQQHQQPQGRQKKQQQQQHRRGNQPNSDHLLHHNSAGNKKSRQSFKGAPVSNHVNSYHGANFQPTLRKNHAPSNNVKDQLFNYLLQQFLAQQPQF